MNIESLDKEIIEEIYNALCKLEKKLQRDINDKSFYENLSFNKYCCMLIFKKNKLLIRFESDVNLIELREIINNGFSIEKGTIIGDKTFKCDMNYNKEKLFNLSTDNMIKFYERCIISYDKTIKNKISKLNELKNIEFKT